MHLKQFSYLLLLLATAVLAACGMVEVALEEPAAPLTTPITQPAPALPTPTTATPTPPVAEEVTPTAAEPGATTFDSVTIFLVAMDDDGRLGPRIGCGDSLVAVARPVTPTTAPLRAALTELLSLGDALYGEDELYNGLHHSDLEVATINIEGRRAIVHLTGNFMLGGTCDDPRIVEQLRATVLQFHTIDEAEIYINGLRLEGYLEQADPVESGGLHLAYVKDNNIWLWRERGAQVALTTSGGVEAVNISDDGRFIAFTRGQELWAVNSSGDDERRLVSAGDLARLVSNDNLATVHHFAWVPDDYFVAFNTRQLFDGPGLVLNDDLHLVNAISGEVSTLLAPGSGGEFTYSDDGQQIAVVTPGAISLMAADGRNRRQVLTYTPVVTYSEYQFYARPRWSAGGSDLLVVIPPADPLADPADSTAIFRLFSDGRPARQVKSVAATPLYSLPALSPDLTHVAYLQPAGENQAHLVIAMLEAGEPLLYAHNVQEFNGWAPDSEQFVFAADLTSRQLGRIGAGPRPLPGAAGLVVDLRWVDNERYIFFSQTLRGWDLVLAHLGGAGDVVDSVASLPTSYDFSR